MEEASNPAKALRAAWRRSQTWAASCRWMYRYSTERGFRPRSLRAYWISLGPTSHLLAGPAVEGEQVVQARSRAERMRVQDLAADPGDIQESERPGQKPVDGRLVGGVQHSPAGPSAGGYLVPQLYRRKGLAVDGF